ncbi:MAG: dTDP-4-dehydrorhamnose 3,5-epimerase [Pyrinomonadaceae bacterium]|nr:dTDP-4-dehydrorhamnose 3,5-epimerase [Pyrinomonadaceae bacterium]MBP6213370.1 dTDP-4-dehydrorhamnose 3,5-epimerase [Pyrinomonadaceae bacterium]
MRLLPTKLAGAYIFELEPIRDERGFFVRTYERKILAQNGLITEWEQESVSFNRRTNTLRGLHFQLPPLVETKIVRVSHGAIIDVFVDLRKESETFLHWESVELTGTNDRAIYIPAGFAHGFCTLADDTTIEYKIDVPYKSDLAAGIRWNDPQLAIAWKVAEPIISERDAALPYLADLSLPF